MPSNFDPRRDGKVVRVVACYTVMCGGRNGRKPMAVISFSNSGRVLEPFLLDPIQLHALIRDLMQVLAELTPKDQVESDTLVSDSIRLPPLPPQPKSKTRPKSLVEPSRNSRSPSHPISAMEAWHIHRMLNNIENHEQFLKLIEAPILHEDSPPRQHKKKRKGK
jgi:hypothetical protein